MSQKYHCDNCNAVIENEETMFVVRQGLVEWMGATRQLCSSGCVYKWADQNDR